MSAVESEVALSYVRRRNLSSPTNGVAGQVPHADCPAASATLARSIIGTRRAGSETVDFFPQPVGFPRVLRELKDDALIERELRMVGPCVKTACPHWFGSCVLGHAVADVGGGQDAGEGCSIAPRCRWRLENGPTVCGPCAGILNVEMKEFINGAVS